MTNCRHLSVPKSRAVASFYEADPKFFSDPKQRRKARHRKSYYQHKGVLYKTKYIHTESVLSFEPEELEILFDNLEYTLSEDEGRSIGLPRMRESFERLKEEVRGKPGRIRERLLRNRLQSLFNVSIMSSVSLEFASDITLFWCSECQKLYFPSEIVADTKYCYPLCPHCLEKGKRRILEQSPVWVAKEGDWDPIRPLTTGTYLYRKNNFERLRNYWNQGELPVCPQCGRGRMRLYIHRDPARFLESSILKCDSCGYEKRLYNANYTLSLPSPHITRPIIGKTYNYLDVEDVRGRVETGEDHLNLKGEIGPPLIETDYIEDFLYIPSISVKKVVLGLVFGLRVRRIYPARKTGVEINTSALYLRLSPTYYPQVKEFMERLDEELYERKAPHLGIEKNLRHVVLHSLAHALMGRLPNYSGLSLDNFEYIYSPNRNEILIYEAGEGSLGALETLTQRDEETGEPIIVDYLQRVKEEVVGCSCDGACKYCLALPGCQEYNQNLDRFSLGPIFGVEEPEEMIG